LPHSHATRHRRAVVTGTVWAAVAGLMWGLVFVVPTLLSAYPAALLAFGRYLAFGLVVLPLAWLDRARLAQLSRADWRDATALTLVGNFAYYLLLAASIQRTGGALTTVIIGSLPMMIAIASNRRNAQRDGLLPWRKLAPSLLLIAGGIALVNQEEMAALSQPNAAHSLADYALGALLGLGALACWTWYPIRNADWLRTHADRPPSTWATAQGLVTLPLAVVGLVFTWLLGAANAWPGATSVALSGFDWPLGPHPWRYVGLMAVLGLLASWAGTLCWNEASQRLPTALAGQLIVFETVSALAYTYLWRGQWPGGTTSLGIGLLLGGVWLGLRIKPIPSVATGKLAHSPSNHATH
jgi:drug/metabolite transporter (DMT)-like permease